MLYSPQLNPSLKIFKTIALLSLSAFFSTFTFAQLEITISKSQERNFPILITNFGIVQDGDKTDIASIIASDLQSSGSFLVSQNEGRFNVSNLDYSYLRSLGVDAVTVGEVAIGLDGYEVSYQLVDVYLQKPIATRRYQSSQAELVSIAHQISDDIYENILGIPGHFNTKIAYVTVQKNQVGSQYTLEVADSDGRNARAALRSNQPILSPTFSNDGKKIAYVSFENQRPRVYIQSIFQKQKRFVLPDFGGVAGAPSFSPDDRYLALSLSRNGNQDIYLYNLTDGRLSQITSHPSIDTEPVFSKDGQSIYFTSDRSKLPQVYRFKLNYRKAERVSFSGRNNSTPALSPDGHTLAVVEGNYGDYHISTIDLKNNQTRQVSAGNRDESPSFSPNGRMLIFASSASGRGVLTTVSLENGKRSQLKLKSGEVREPVWSPALP